MPGRYTPLRGRAKAVTVVFAGLLLLYAMAVWSGLLELGGEKAEEIKAGVTTSVVADFVALACAMFAIALVRMATDRLDEKAAALPGPQPALEPGFAAPERPAGVPAWLPPVAALVWPARALPVRRSD